MTPRFYRDMLEAQKSSKIIKNLLDQLVARSASVRLAVGCAVAWRMEQNSVLHESLKTRTQWKPGVRLGRSLTQVTNSSTIKCYRISFM